MRYCLDEKRISREWTVTNRTYFRQRRRGVFCALFTICRFTKATSFFSRGIRDSKPSTILHTIFIHINLYDIYSQPTEKKIYNSLYMFIRYFYTSICLNFYFSSISTLFLFHFLLAVQLDKNKYVNVEFTYTNIPRVLSYFTPMLIYFFTRHSILYFYIIHLFFVYLFMHFFFWFLWLV